MSDFKVEPNSPTWLAVKAYAETEIEKARTRLEMPSLTPSETDFERGQIKALRELLKLSAEQKRVEFNTDTVNF